MPPKYDKKFPAGKVYSGGDSKTGKKSINLSKFEGMKWDGDKLRYDLIPPFAEEELAKVLTYGASKYDDNNWIFVKNAKSRYFAAFRRHIAAFRKGESMDPETGLHHIAHAICNLCFLLEKEMFTEEELNEKYKDWSRKEEK